ncbi:HET-domain-containing protein [Lophium mytilinum]|uniref:HET-domain-containing protein n=1 Tax=Lophium mytilinum TaxID=390894 RepID=A0A6A6QH88_9PEZI|nr:HET-domain-containing protein [Lophium mytilinum]
MPSKFLCCFGKDLTKNPRGQAPRPIHVNADTLPSEKKSRSRRKSNRLSIFTPALYDDLPTDDSVRLLRLERGSGDDIITCNLSHTRLHEGHQAYEALSYVWGQRSDAKEVICNKQKVFVTGNLHQALKRLRKPDVARWIWVDAVCINQEDPGERGHQVRQMHAIYKGACRVIVWLGDDFYDEGHNAFSIVCAIANTSHMNPWVQRPATFRSLRKNPPPTDTQYPPDLGSQLWRSVTSLFLNNWFVRMWVIQEIVLAQEATLIWGDVEIDWKWVGIAVDHIRQDTKLHALLESRNMQNAYFMHYICGQQLDKNPNTHPFLHLLDWARSFDVSDPRDKIYGLLGFPTKHTNLEKGDVFLEPDYTQTVHEIYTEVAKKVLNQDNTLDLLSFVTHEYTSIDAEGKLKFEFPSWVPDWSQKIVVFPFMGFGSGNGFQASTSMPMEEIPCDNPNWLRLKGVEVDVVTTALPYFPFCDLIDAESKLVNWVKSAASKGDTAEMIANTLTAGRCEHGWLLDDDDRHIGDFIAFLDEQDPDWVKENWPDDYPRLLEIASDHGNPDRGKEALWRYSCYRTPFHTKKGKLGLGPGTLQNDDIICVLFGAQVPFVIRPEGDYYRFIGECYIGDIMHEEAVDAWKEGSEEVTERVFELR